MLHGAQKTKYSCISEIKKILDNNLCLCIEKIEYEQKGPAVANWFKYTTSTPIGDGLYTSQTSIFYINTDGTIERAGSESYEYFGTELEMIQNTLSWSICRENSNTDSLNVKFEITEPPIWADNTSDDNSNDDLERILDLIKQFNKIKIKIKSGKFCRPIPMAMVIAPISASAV